MEENSQSTIPPVIMIEEDTRMTEKEKEVQARIGRTEEETRAQKMKVTVKLMKEIQEEIEERNRTRMMTVKIGGVLAMGIENTAQRPLVMGGL